MKNEKQTNKKTRQEKKSIFTPVFSNGVKVLFWQPDRAFGWLRAGCNCCPC